MSRNAHPNDAGANPVPWLCRTLPPPGLEIAERAGSGRAKQRHSRGFLPSLIRPGASWACMRRGRCARSSSDRCWRENDIVEEVWAWQTVHNNRQAVSELEIS